MNIQLKYKIRNNHNKKVSICYTSLVEIENHGLSNIIGLYDYEVLSRQQYTGYYDIKGTDIYEGDSVEFCFEKGLIKKKGENFVIDSPSYNIDLMLKDYLHLVIIDRDATNKSEKL